MVKMNKILSIENYNFQVSDKLLLDTNIWLLLYGPQKPTDRRVKIYSDAFLKILKAKSDIYIDVLVVSEFINTYSRQMYNISNSSENFKKFRQSNQFKPIASEIADMVKRIMERSSRIENGFKALSITTLMDEYAVGDSDFNDQILTEVCKKENLILITDDGDFKKQKLSILTANKKLLSNK